MAIDKAVDSTILDGYFDDIANAIRTKTGGSDTYTPAQMAQAITNIPSGGSDDRFDKMVGGILSGDVESDASGVGQYKFYGDSLSSITLPNGRYVSYRAFQGCPHLQKVDIGMNVTTAITIESQAFYMAGELTALIIRPTDQIATLNNTNALRDTSIEFATGYIYVPRALISTYQAATNWTTYAAQFRAIEDYTVDGTVTGDLDPTKI